MDNESLSAVFIILLVLLFPLGFGLIWGGVIFLLAWLSGWRRLARHYRSTVTPSGQTIGGFWAMVGPVSYRGILTIQATPAGLFLSVMVLFRLGHPALLIPWSAIHSQGAPQGFLTKWLAFDLGEPKCTTLRIPARSADQDVLARYLGTASR